MESLYSAGILESVGGGIEEGIVDEVKRNRLILENLPLVRMVTQRLCPRLPPQVEMCDLLSAGVLGLIDAAKKFDSSRAARFRTYAEIRVRGAILDYLRHIGWAPRSVYRRAREVEAARSAIEQREHRSAMLSELASELGVPANKCQKLLLDVDRLNFLDLDSPGEDSATDRRSQTVANSNPEAELERKEALDLICRAIEILPERQKLILWLYYCEDLTLKEVGAVLGVNEARASQLHSKAIGSVRREASRLSGWEIVGRPEKRRAQRRK
jgi:RNA polymerase sigma factor for flagellar operon FliA